MSLIIRPLKFTNLQLLEELKLRLSFHFDSIKVEVPDIDIEETYNVQRQQYYSTKIIEAVKKLNITSEDYILIITEMDLFVPVLTHIYGEAELRGKYSIVSTCRLHEEFYTSERNTELLLERTYKEIMHELGHNFGLLHCKDWQCVMHSSSGIEEVDLKSSLYCDSCKTNLLTKDIKFLT